MDRLESFHRYHIKTSDALPAVPQPGKFAVRIDKVGFFKMAAQLLSESSSLSMLAANFGSRPCIYGVYDGTFGGLQARESLCRGCLRCMIEHPEVARIELSREFKRLGDSYWTPEQVLTVWNEAATGRIPVRGMGYGGPFRGPGFDDIWTDFSEIVRPTRDGIHGREYISTAVDAGTAPLPLGEMQPSDAPVLALPLPILLEAPGLAGHNRRMLSALAEAASRTRTLLVAEASDCEPLLATHGTFVAPVATGELPAGARPLLIEWPATRERPMPPLRRMYEKASSLWCARLRMAPGFEEQVCDLVRKGVTCVHAFATYHGREHDAAQPRFVTDLTRSVHGRLVEAGLRDRVTLIVSGGIVAAEHVPKTILCGADLVAIETAAMVALQADWSGDWTGPGTVEPKLPEAGAEWMTQRVMNLLCAWRDQLLEVMGAMGLRDVRRLRGETGRAMFASKLEEEIFSPLFGKRRHCAGEPRS